MLADRLQIHMSISELEEHFLRHRCEQRVVLNSIIRDLLEIVDVAKNNCVVLSEDGARATEARNTAVYLDAMKLIMSIYRQLEHGRGRAS